MPYVPYHLVAIMLFVLPMLAQVVLYKIVSNYLGDLGMRKEFTKRYLPVIFLIINIPFVLVRVSPQMFIAGLPRHLIIIPFYAYETLSVAILLVALLVYLTKSVLRPLQALRQKKARERRQEVRLESRRLFLKKAAIGLGAYTFLGSMYSIYNRDDYRVDNVPLRLKNLPPQLQGLRIVMISDIHSGLYMTEDDMSRYYDEVIKLKPDLIFIPGDFVTSKTYEILPFVKSFAGLRSKFGTYACLGNHDFFGNPNIITEKLRENNINVLRNETWELDINNAKLMLSGVDDGAHADFKKVIYEANSLNTTRILLCHKPYYFDTAVEGGYDAMLSGHTHGGQIVLANLFGFKLTPATFVSPYVSGKYYRGDSVMYVSRGIGTVGLPVRLNCPPEITIFTLQKKT